MTAPRVIPELDEEQLIEREERGGRPVAASVAWDVRDLPPREWGTDADPWRTRVELDVLGLVERRLGVTTSDVCARLSVEPTQANRIRAGKCLRALGWNAGAQSSAAGKKLPRRYSPASTTAGTERLSPRSTQGSFPLDPGPPVGAPPPRTSAGGLDRLDPTTWKLAQRSGIPGQPDWVYDLQGRIVPRPLRLAMPSARVAQLRQRRAELSLALNDIDAELARLGAR